MNPHKLFPLGLNCAHCERWHNLRDAIEHAEEFHQDCPSCGAEVMLSKALLDEAAGAVAIVSERRTRRAQAVSE